MDGVGAVEGSDLNGGRRPDEEESDKNVQNKVCIVVFVSDLISQLGQRLHVGGSSHLADFTTRSL
jgi:hypothetical protein